MAPGVIRGNGLRPAHKGYLYQDLLTAYVLACAVVDRPEKILVDIKQSKPDIFDDLEVVSGGKRTRWQIKSSEDAGIFLSVAKFTQSSSDLRFDLLVKTDLSGGGFPATEYRLCATWGVPISSDPLAALLIPAPDVEPTVMGTSSKTFRLDSISIWPDGGEPIWSCLKSNDHGMIAREQFIYFCSRFVLELAMPASSGSLLKPQPIERALIETLSQGVGIGRYPNLDRSAVDVAALLIGLATRARSGHEQLTPLEIERELGIRTDFGRISQAYPIDETVYHDRLGFRYSLLEGVSSGVHQLVCGQPGAGKSWELTRLAEELRESEFIVARHYCFLEPGDELVERRVTSDVLFGNLRAEILDAVPDLTIEVTARYAAGPKELEATLAAADRKGVRVVLLIDGLDHIARVRAESRRLSEAETDIIARLAMLNLPASTVVVVGSQPGQHLDPLRERLNNRLAEHRVPPWDHADMVALAKRHGVDTALMEAGMDAIPALNALADRAEGNPLYLHYLAKGLIASLRASTIISAAEWVRSFPSAAGDIGRYYEHLYRTASERAHAVADLLAFVDFSVTASDLGEILGPALKGWIAPALNHLAPILTSAVAQGGVRIFHESFRRFMAEEMARQGRSATDILQPVITWLGGQGFFENAKAYRFLLPALQRAGRGSEVLGWVDKDFVSRSVEHGHPIEAIRRNLLLAADVAMHIHNWPVAARVSELQRAADSAYDQGLPAPYWPTYLAIFGPEALSARLTFDGKPTLQTAEGLKCCSLIDDAGGAAPWAEYLTLDSDEDGPEETKHTRAGDDPSAEWPADGEVVLAKIHGQIRQGRLPALRKNVALFLIDQQDQISVPFIRAVAARMARSGTISTVRKLVALARSRGTRPPIIPPRAGAALCLGIADELKRLGDTVGARQASAEALALADVAWIACECIEFGVSPEPVGYLAIGPDSLEAASGTDHYLHGDRGVRQWMASVRILAHTSPPDVLETEKARLHGIGWFRSWLRFVLVLAQAEAAANQGKSADWAGAFKELVADTDPFAGTPRACDLYSIRNLIKQSISWGLSGLTSASQWQIALDCLLKAQSATATHLFREDGGPISVATLLELLLNHVKDPEGGSLVRAALGRLFEASHSGTYYQTHAEHSFLGAQIAIAFGDRKAALAYWPQASIYVSAYGWHKDTTLFDLIESAGSLSPRNREGALKALADCYPLIGPVLRHTDGKDTKHAPGTWLQILAAVDPGLALDVIARSEMERWGGAWWDEDTLDRIGDAVLEAGADPVLVDACLATVPLDDDRSEASVERRLRPIAEMLKSDRELSLQSLRRLLAEVANDTLRSATAAIKPILAFAELNGLQLPAVPALSQPAEESLGHRMAEGSSGQLWRLRLPPFPPNATVLDLMAGLRKAEETRGWNGPETWDDVVLALGYYLPNLVEIGEEKAAARIVRFFAREIRIFDSDGHPLAGLAESLERVGCRRIAAITYVLAFAATRGNGGWRYMGDMSHQHLLAAAMGIDTDAALSALADEIADGIRDSRFGLSRRIIEIFAVHGDPLVAEQVWRECHRVVAHRLPSATARLETWGAPPCFKDAEISSIDEGLISVLLARLARPLVRVKLAALKGIALAVQKSHRAVPAPLRRWLLQDAHASSLSLVFQAIYYVESQPFVISVAISDLLEGYAQGNHWGLSRLSGALLERIGKTRPTNRTIVVLPESRPERVSGLAVIAGGDGLDKLRSVWPSLAEITEQQVAASIRNVEIHKERCRDTWKIMYGRDGKAKSPTRVLQWEVELFQSKLNEFLFGLRRELWIKGVWGSQVEDEIAFSLLPKIQGHLSHFSSRCPRPRIEKPSEMVEAVERPLIVENDADEYNGWFRLAHVEEECISTEENHRTFLRVISYSSVVALPDGGEVPDDALPFARQDVEKFFVLPGGGVMGGALVALAKHKDWLCEIQIMRPVSWVVKVLGLTEPKIGSPLIWRDGTGKPAAVYRCWRVRAKGVYEGDPADLSGADLLLRGDLFRRLSAILPLKLEYVTRMKSLRN